MLRSLGGEVAGSARAPLGESDYSSYLVRAAASGAQAVGICAGGNDMVNIAKQMGEFGLIRRGIVPAALNCSLTSVRSVGLETGHGMVYAASDYWDRTDATRASAARFARIHGRPPTAFQAGSYGAVAHYLKAVQTAGTDATAPVMAKMRETPINDFMTRDGTIRADGRVMRDVFLTEVKAPRESRGEWDLLKVVQTDSGEDAFRPLGQGGGARWCNSGDAADGLQDVTHLHHGHAGGLHHFAHDRILVPRENWEASRASGACSWAACRSAGRLGCGRRW